MPPATESWLPREQTDDQSGHGLRQLIGYVGLVLPGVLIVLAIARDGFVQWQNLESVSAYYYTGAVTAFVGMLVTLSLFLFAYKGYENKYHWADRGVGITAAIAALGVAFFPTAAPEGVVPLSWWLPSTGHLHYAAAILLFSMFALYALWLFRITPNKAQITWDKRWRNWVYLGCGVVIVGSMVWAGIAGYYGRPIFAPESVALVAFAISWLIKGYALTTVTRVARSLFARRQ